MKKIGYIIAGFGGPRDLKEVFPFLQSLLTDQEIIRTKLPKIIHRLLFTRIAKKRSKKLSMDYETIGGKSPIFADTEALKHSLSRHLKGPIITFHRYLPATHNDFIHAAHNLQCDEIRVFPLFPQFTYATTGSVALWFQQHLPPTIVNKMRWVKSYPTHPGFVKAHQNSIRNFLQKHQLSQKDTILLFSAHGLPRDFITKGDIYEDECQASFNAVMKAFPDTIGRLSYQSKFGPGEWLRPYTNDMCQQINSWKEERTNIVFVPISFTSDHIETLFEIEQEYMSIIKEKNLRPYRIPCLTLNPDWVQAISIILTEAELCNNQMLVRHI
ncbi:MAG: Ferrochelatase [Chlamydiae bacterium]|nr:Ferrochelatase [Chlamydiota bacterium]